MLSFLRPSLFSSVFYLPIVSKHCSAAPSSITTDGSLHTWRHHGEDRPITPFDSIGKDRNSLKNYTLFLFSGQLIVALCTLVVCFCGFMDLLLSVEEYEVCFQAFYPAFCWSLTAVTSSKLLLNWTGFWSCVNFQADQTNVPLVTLLICIVMVCLSVFEFFFTNSLLKKRPMCASTTAEVQHHKLRNDIATECANVIIHQQKQKNGSAVM